MYVQASNAGIITINVIKAKEYRKNGKTEIVQSVG